MRMRSPRTAPPLIGLDGSIATTAIARPLREPARRAARRPASTCRCRATPVMPTTGACRRARASDAAASRAPGRSSSIASAGARARAGRRRDRAARRRRTRRDASARLAAAGCSSRSDDDQRLAEAELAAQRVQISPCVRPARAPSTTAPKTLPSLALGGARELVERLARPRRSSAAPSSAANASRWRCIARGVRPFGSGGRVRGVVVDLVRVDADDDLLAGSRRGPGSAAPTRRSSAARGRLDRLVHAAGARRSSAMIATIFASISSVSVST